MKPLESRKQLLIAESELNRAQLVQEWLVVRAEVHALTRQAKTLRAMVSAVATLVAGMSSLGHKKTVPAAEKPSWLQSVLKGAGLVSTLWQSFRPTGSDQPQK